MGDNNVFLGASSAANNLAGSNNVVIGTFADVGSDNLTNAIAIGHRAEVVQSNSLVLGSINGVNFSNVDTNVGIGTPAPQARLDVRNGNILVGSPGQGIILRSPNGGMCRLISIDNAGALILSPVACP